MDVNIRLISATNKNIYEAVKSGILREDFLYRINGIVICVPPLRERPEDIESFIHFFVKKFEMELKKKIEYIDEETMNFLKNYHYPGNIRELKNIIERLIVLAEGSAIHFKNAKRYLQHTEEDAVSHSDENLRDAREQFEIEFIRSKIKDCKGNLSKAAAALDISKRQLNNKILEYNLREWIQSLKD